MEYNVKIKIIGKLHIESNQYIHLDFNGRNLNLHISKNVNGSQNITIQGCILNDNNDPIYFGFVDTHITDDEYFKNIDNIVFVKIDVEGMEMNVLKGAVDTISKHRPFLFVEYTKQVNGGKDLKEFIEAMDYTIYITHQYFVCIPNERVDSKIQEILNEL